MPTASSAQPDIQRCPFHFFAQLHQEAPIYKDPMTGFLVVSVMTTSSFITEQLGMPYRHDHKPCAIRGKLGVRYVAAHPSSRG
jgi:hypothetical protein